MLTDAPATLSDILTRLALDGLWQLLAGMGLTLDQTDGDIAGDLHIRLFESVGITTRKNLCWMGTAIRDLDTWATIFTFPPGSPSSPT
jgi:hypothetical protein